MSESKSFNGIISYLTKKHGGNVQAKGIVKLTSKTPSDQLTELSALQNVADFATESAFQSNDDLDQWICWDFGEMRVLPTGYTMKAVHLQTWVLESSMDGKYWTEIDRHEGNHDFFGFGATVSYTVSTPKKCRFIRLTQTGMNHVRRHQLILRAFEFFGTLSE
jgi:hypothetical protein